MTVASCVIVNVVKPISIFMYNAINLNSEIMKRIFAAIIYLSLFTACRKDSGPYIAKSADTISYISFSKDIQPVFDKSCISCHNETNTKLNLKPCCSYTQLWTGGTNAPYVDTLNPAQSRLHQSVSGASSLPMPPSGSPLPQQEIDLILQWIKEGARNN